MKIAKKQKTKEDLDLSKVKVLVKVRPFVSGEVKKKCVLIDQGSAEVQLRRDSELYTYTFDGTYDSETSQEEFFSQEVAPIVDTVFKGINTTIFAYGITGAGKTFTMQGGAGDQRGIIPRVAEKVMEYIEDQQRGAEPLKAKTQYSVSLSYLEIYNEKVYDLLRPKDQDLPIREDQEKNIFIPNLAKLPVTSYEQFMDTYDLGCKNRTTAPTALNSSSSRSHAVLIITVKHADSKQRKLTGKLHLIDLAGSEDNRRTDNMGMRMVESTNINRSLFVLGKVVNALNDGSSRVPYRDSKLTRLLQDSLGGRSYGIMVANLSPAMSHYQDTYNTLNFAAKSRKIVNKPVVNSVTTAPVVDAAERRAKLLAYSQKKAAASAKKSEYSGEDKENVSINTTRGSSFVGTNSKTTRKPLQTKSTTTQQQKGKTSPSNMDELIERKLERKLAHLQAQGLIGPQLRGKKILDEEGQERLESLEKKVMVLAMTAAEQKINNCFPEVENEGEEEEEEEKESPGQSNGDKRAPSNAGKKTTASDKPKGGNLKVGMTPLTSAQSAMSYIKKAKKVQTDGNLIEALRLYKKAQELIDNPRLKKKIKQLEALTRAGNEEDEEQSMNVEENEEEEEEEENEKNSSIADVKNKRKAETEREKLAYETNRKRRKVSNNDKHEDYDAEEEAARCIIKRRPSHEDEEYEDEEDEERASDDEFVPEAEKKKREKASEVFSYASPPKDQQQITRRVLRILNTGSLKELTALHGIGKKRAETILTFRAVKEFTSLEELRKIGLGDKLFQTFMQRNVYEAS